MFQEVCNALLSQSPRSGPPPQKSPARDARVRAVSPSELYHSLDGAGSWAGHWMRVLLAFPAARLVAALSLAVLFSNLSARAGSLGSIRNRGGLTS